VLITFLMSSQIITIRMMTIVLMMQMIPRIPTTIWFAGTGTNKAEWATLPGVTESILLMMETIMITLMIS
jgi:hypothetical protein